MVQQNGHGRLLGGATMIVAAAASVAILAGAGFAWAQQPTAAAAPRVSGTMAPQLVAGAAMIVYPYFVASVGWMIAIAAVIVAALTLAVRAGL